MDIMKVSEAMLVKNGRTILTGPLLLKEFTRRSEIEKAFGKNVTISVEDGSKLTVPVLGVSVSQAMSGSWQVSIAVNYTNQNGSITLDSLVSNDK